MNNFDWRLLPKYLRLEEILNSHHFKGVSWLLGVTVAAPTHRKCGTECVAYIKTRYPRLKVKRVPIKLVTSETAAARYLTKHPCAKDLSVTVINVSFARTNQQISEDLLLKLFGHRIEDYDFYPMFSHKGQKQQWKARKEPRRRDPWHKKQRATRRRSFLLA